MNCLEYLVYITLPSTPLKLNIIYNARSLTSYVLFLIIRTLRFLLNFTFEGTLSVFELSKGFNLLFFIWADMIIREWAELLGFEKRKPNTIITILDGGLHCVDYLMPANRNRGPFSNFLTHDLPNLKVAILFSQISNEKLNWKFKR